LYYTFYKSVGHDDQDCRAYNLLHESSRDIIIFRAKYNKKEILHSTTLQGEENSLLMVDTEDKDEEEVWDEAEDK
jgi:hypothetical protein